MENTSKNKYFWLSHHPYYKRNKYFLHSYIYEIHQLKGKIKRQSLPEHSIKYLSHRVQTVFSVRVLTSLYKTRKIKLQLLWLNVD